MTASHDNLYGDLLKIARGDTGPVEERLTRFRDFANMVSGSAPVLRETRKKRTMTWTKFIQIAREEFVHTARAFFLPVTFLWVLITKGWSAAKAHFLKVYRPESPTTRRRRSRERNLMVDEEMAWGQSGGIECADGSYQHYDMKVPSEGGWAKSTIQFTDRDDAPQTKAMLVPELLRHLDINYHIEMPEGGWRKMEDFSEVEKYKLRPIAETLAMLNGNAFFGSKITDGREWYEQYLPQADALYQSNGGKTGWAGQSSFEERMSGFVDAWGADHDDITVEPVVIKPAGSKETPDE